jgi:hypothetical protein
MPIIVWGTRGITSTLQHGEFHCPRCDAREEYKLENVRPFFTLFFIPLFPVGGGQRYVECLGCRGTYREEVLQYKPPSETERFLGQIYEELRTGTSLDMLQGKIVNMTSMAPEKARGVLEQMCDGRPRTCACGEQYHPEVPQCPGCGAKL